MSTEKLASTESCPYCGATRDIPKYAYAHWSDLFTVTCGNKDCLKQYSFFQGITQPMVQRKTKRKK